MIRSEYALVADFAQIGDKGKANVMGIATRFTPIVYPSFVAPMYLVARVFFSDNPHGKVVEFRTLWKNRSGVDQGQISGQMRFDSDDQTPDTQIVVMLPPFQLNEPGEYSAVLEFDGETIATATLTALPLQETA